MVSATMSTVRGTVDDVAMPVWATNTNKPIAVWLGDGLIRVNGLVSRLPSKPQMKWQRYPT